MYVVYLFRNINSELEHSITPPKCHSIMKTELYSAVKSKLKIAWSLFSKILGTAFLSRFPMMLCCFRSFLMFLETEEVRVWIWWTRLHIYQKNGMITLEIPISVCFRSNQQQVSVPCDHFNATTTSTLFDYPISNQELYHVTSRTRPIFRTSDWPWCLQAFIRPVKIYRIWLKMTFPILILPTVIVTQHRKGADISLNLIIPRFSNSVNSD